MQSLDMTELLLEAYRLADQINDSKEVKRYLELKRKIAEDPTAQSLIKEFQKKKDVFEDCQRFGHFHPDYHAAKKEAQQFRRAMKDHPLIGEYLELEEWLDHLLAEVSRRIARAVSDTVKVPINDPRELRKANRNRRNHCG
ncbi:YlbF family regulator [Kroppenstedtia eburnea]|uniref:YlbF family regulator n=1 Tax=Kroppenstedtia eburnea TaxID=714067 RepID=UPI00362EC6FD